MHVTYSVHLHHHSLYLLNIPTINYMKISIGFYHQICKDSETSEQRTTNSVFSSYPEYGKYVTYKIEILHTLTIT